MYWKGTMKRGRFLRNFGKHYLLAGDMQPQKPIFRNDTIQIASIIYGRP
jgi:hypothetical protein